ncbi:MAG: hypothetical protein LUP99_02605 [Methanomicrobiales archaeon]|nr:hypothetical protein [Methanomicrobiales archaeon]
MTELDLPHHDIACPHCGKRFSSQSKYLKHRDNEHPEQSSPPEESCTRPLGGTYTINK